MMYPCPKTTTSRNCCVKSKLSRTKPNATIGEPVAGEVAKPATRTSPLPVPRAPGAPLSHDSRWHRWAAHVMLLFGILPLINVGSISTIAAGAVGGVCGYGVVRLSKRGGRGDKS